ncbi:NACHT domain-containing protein [Streptomyces termitum]
MGPEGGGTRQEISGGTQHNVVFARDIGTVEIHGPHGFRSGGAGRLGPVVRLAAGLAGLLLLVARPGLPLPQRIDLGPVAWGWLLIGGALLAEAGARLNRAVARRRRAAWRSEKNLARAADALAEGLAFRYGQDETLTRVHDPRPLAVNWTTGPAAPPAGTGGEGGGPAGAVDDDEAVAGLLAATPLRRLVVLGGAGAGKSVLLLRLAHALLKARAPGTPEPVPAVVSLSSWDPDRGLLRWTAERLAEEYPAAFAPAEGAPPTDVALHLLLTGRVLPLFDGFDELPAHRRAEAFRQLVATMQGGRSFVLASREPEYREHAPEEGLFARTEIRLSPLSGDALRACLAPAGSPGRWTPVLDRLDAAGEGESGTPEARLREVLGVPLMASLARVAYGHGASDPRELLEPARFDSVREVERHLYDAFLDVVYSASHDVRAAHGGWAPERARAWAGFLASRMREENEQDLAWWRLEEAVPGPVRVLALAPAFALTVWLVAATGFGETWWDRWTGLPLGLPGAFALLCGLVLTAAAAVRRGAWAFPPRRLARPAVADVLPEGRLARWKAGLVVLGLVAGWAVLLPSGGFARLMAVPTAIAVWAGGARLTAAVWPRSDTASADSPAGLLRADRRGVLLLGWAAPVAKGADETPLIVLVLPIGVLAFWQLGGGADTVSGPDWLRLAVGLPVAWVLYAVGASAWGGFTVARLYLWATGRLPRRLMPFLADAHARGVLRQSGGVYRFRHIELRDRLARDTGGAPPVRPRSRPRRVLGGLLATLSVLAALAFGSGVFTAAPLPGPVRALPEPCALLDAEDLGRLMEDPAVLAGEEGGTCGAGEQAPFARDVRIAVGAWLFTREGASASGPDLARKEYRTTRSWVESWVEGTAAAGGFHRALPGLGDEAYAAGRSGSYRTTEEDASPRGSGEVGVLFGNVFLRISYEEEFASPERAAGAARLLAEEAARRAGLPGGPARTGEGSLGAGSVAELPPRTAVPPKDNRFAFYSRRPARSVRGATWRDDDRSYLWSLRWAPVVFRAPKHLDCVRAEGDDPVAYTCAARPGPVRAGLLPGLRLSLRFHGCGDSCDQKEIDAFVRALPDGGAITWRAVDPSTSVASADRTGRRRIDMVRHWSRRDAEGRPLRPQLLWVRAEVPEADAATAEKIVNDLFTQTGGSSANR